ncbi:MAG: hypothetical protein JSV21_11715 [Nitrospirota bacterium]|nr:MAG: hypothetical protein JSV21_11715 [Nitrospirota bacterium]
MKDLLVLISPIFWSIKNDLLKADRTFYRRFIMLSGSSVLFILLITSFLNKSMIRLQSIAPDLFGIILIKGYSFMFLIIFGVQVLNGFVFALNSFYQSRELEVIMVSPVDKDSLFFARLLDTQIKALWMLAVFGLPLLVAAGITLNAGPVYYPFSILIFIVFSSIPVNIGILIAIVLSKFLHTRRLKRILLTMGVLTIAVITTLFRIYRPERFINPELFANVTLFINELNTASHVLLPNRWLGESVFGLIQHKDPIILVHIMLLITTSYLTAILAMLAFRRFHEKGWALLQEGGSAYYRAQTPEQKQRPIIDLVTALFNRSISIFSVKQKMFFKKELIYQVRDIKNVHQLLILLSLVIVYLFSISSLPLDWADIIYALKLKYFTAFFNIGLIATIIAALCTRIIYQSVLNDKDSFWLMRTAPVSPSQYVMSKYLFFFLPICILGLLLTIFSFRFIDIDNAVMVLEIFTVIVICSSLTALAIYTGTADMVKHIRESSKDELKTGNIIFMIGAVILIALTLTFEAVPVFLYFLAESKQASFVGKTWAVILASSTFIILINLITAWLSLRSSIKKIDSVELG